MQTEVFADIIWAADGSIIWGLYSTFGVVLFGDYGICICGLFSDIIEARLCDRRCIAVLFGLYMVLLYRN